jgi:hypothetical protein
MHHYILGFKAFLKKCGKAESTVSLYAGWVEYVLRHTDLNPNSLLSPPPLRLGYFQPTCN